MPVLSHEKEGASRFTIAAVQPEPPPTLWGQVDGHSSDPGMRCTPPASPGGGCRPSGWSPWETASPAAWGPGAHGGGARWGRGQRPCQDDVGSLLECVPLSAMCLLECLIIIFNIYSTIFNINLLLYYLYYYGIYLLLHLFNNIYSIIFFIFVILFNIYLIFFLIFSKYLTFPKESKRNRKNLWCCVSFVCFQTIVCAIHKYSGNLHIAINPKTREKFHRHACCVQVSVCTICTAENAVGVS